MILKQSDNGFGHKIVQCPFCSKVCFVRGETRSSPDALRDLKRHILNASKKEALQKVVEESGLSPHLDYYKEHTTEVEIILPVLKRKFDNDMTL